MLYLSPALAMLSFPDDAPPITRHGDTLYYRLTVDLWAWVIQSCHKARKAHEAGRLSADTLATLRDRFRAIQAAIPQFDPAALEEALSRPQGLPSPDGPTEATRPAPTSPAPSLDAALTEEVREAALAAHDLDHPPAFDGTDRSRVLLSWPDHPGFLVLTTDRLDALLAWNAAVDARARKAAGSSKRRQSRTPTSKDQTEIDQPELPVNPERR